MKFTFGLFFGLLVGCASSMGDGLLRFQDREFLVHPDKPGLGYPYEERVCTPRRWFPDKCTNVWKEEFYDMNDKQTRQRFIDASCTVTCAGRFQY